MIKYKIIKIIGLVFLSVLISSWGYVGHRKISYNISSSFNDEMSQFDDWVQFLTDHSSDADYRKNDDPDEGPKHYIDIDNYSVFVSTGRIPQTLDSCITEYGSTFVDNNGYLPWATLDAYDTLVQCFIRKDWEKAKLVAADIGHYVGDGHMPLHITKNYNGQLSGNDGVHSRYESNMVNTYQDQIIYGGSPAEKLEDVRDYIFSYIYHNYSNVQTIIDADDEAKIVSGGSYNTLYYETLWKLTGDMTIELFSEASHAIANLLYTAWSEAGKPDLDSNVSAFTMEANVFEDIVVFPNPCRNSVRLRFELNTREHIYIKVMSAEGRLISILSDEKMDAGKHEVIWRSEGVVPGTYFILVWIGDEMQLRRVEKM